MKNTQTTQTAIGAPEAPKQQPQHEVMRKNVLNIILPRPESLVTGVWRILKAHDLVTLEFSDGNRKSAIIKPDRWAKIHTDSLAIIYDVRKYDESAK